MALPDNGLFGAIAGKKSLPTIEVAPTRERGFLALPGVKAGEDEKLQSCLPGLQLSGRLLHTLGPCAGFLEQDVGENCGQDDEPADAVISTVPGHLRPPSFAVASATMTAVAFAAMAINPANREVAARTTGASRSRPCWDRRRCHAGSARRGWRARGAPRGGGATRAASRRSSPGSRASARVAPRPGNWQRWPPAGAWPMPAGSHVAPQPGPEAWAR